MTGTAKGTVLSLLETAGAACQKHHEETVRNIASKRIQCNEIWGFCYSKQANIPEEHRGEPGYGDMWTWVALDADTKLAVSWMVGDRDVDTAGVFMPDVADRLTSRVQLTTDGHKAYLEAVEGAFGMNVDYAQLVKLYGSEPESERRYSPAHCIGTETHIIQGNPDPDQICTSHIERQNLTMRMVMHRFTRLTNGFSKKAQNLAYAVSLHFLYYNLARPHKSLKGQTPAMAAGLADHVWDIMEMTAVIEAWGRESVKSSERNCPLPGDQLETDDARILAYVREHGSIGIAECRAPLGVDAARAWYLLKKLRSAGRLRQVSSKRAARYLLP